MLQNREKLGQHSIVDPLKSAEVLILTARLKDPGCYSVPELSQEEFSYACNS